MEYANIRQPCAYMLPGLGLSSLPQVTTAGQTRSALPTWSRASTTLIPHSTGSAGEYRVLTGVESRQPDVDSLAYYGTDGAFAIVRGIDGALKIVEVSLGIRQFRAGIAKYN